MAMLFAFPWLHRHLGTLPGSRSCLCRKLCADIRFVTNPVQSVGWGIRIIAHKSQSRNLAGYLWITFLYERDEHATANQYSDQKFNEYQSSTTQATAVSKYQNQYKGSCRNAFKLLRVLDESDGSLEVGSCMYRAGP
ncbi:hypothetical protein BJ138DRAFT_223497 [Hygrophoropsis aurantiaca]|uniref:Uncharacterized protein n=1 Tax=Hygrophoropsis aurantiaca TaxID=72124 RepID=A0ACB8ARQ6_9AGAM|nr:hypothetical protein BJ138DRAFT_223497 [Hygrophoropsis aurantiaca]